MPRLRQEFRQEADEEVVSTPAVGELSDKLITDQLTGSPVEIRKIEQRADGSLGFAKVWEADLPEGTPLGPLPEPECRALPEGLREDLIEVPATGYTKSAPIVEPAWKPDPAVLALMGLQGETVQEVVSNLPEPTFEELLAKELEERLTEEDDEEQPEAVAVPTDQYRVPLEEQLLPGETSVSVVDSAPAVEVRVEEPPRRVVSPAIVGAINRRPWADWSDPTVTTAHLHGLHFEAQGKGLYLATASQRLGAVSEEALSEFGKRCIFPTEFVLKLSSALAAQVINERIISANDLEMSVLFEDGEWIGTTPSWRGILPQRQVADIAYNTLKGYYPDVSVEQASKNGHMNLRLLTPVAYPVTPAEGDVLAMGVDVLHQYGGTLEVSLYVKRLVCLNGMTANSRAFSWRKRSGEAGSVEEQAVWLQEGVTNAINTYTGLVEKAQLMAGTRFEGDYTEVLRERAAAMRLPLRHLPALIGAFEVEGGNNEWALVNAFSRLATHGGLPRDLSRDMQFASGDWVREFNLVTARLPRPVANRVGARILEGTNEA